MLGSRTGESGESTLPLQRKSLAEQIYAILEQRIVSGDFPPGKKLLEESVAEEFGVSRSPAREALSTLERVGLVVRTNGRDRCVSVPTSEWVRDAFEVVWLLDSARTYLSCLNAPESDHRRLYALLDAIEVAERDGNNERQLALSTEFHELLFCRCTNQQLDAMIVQHGKLIEWFKTLYFADLDSSEKSKREHRKIVDCYVRKDLAGLLEAAREHLTSTRDKILLKLSVRNRTTTDEFRS